MSSPNSLRTGSPAPTRRKVKPFRTEMRAIGVDRCLQLFGGQGYMLEQPIARLYADTRSTRVHAGTSEVMKAGIGIAESLELWAGGRAPGAGAR